MRHKMDLQLMTAVATIVDIVHADGVGILGVGKWLYKPVCAHSCRNVLSSSTLLCQPEDDGSRGSHSHSSTEDPECYLVDAAFLRTMALCIDKYCEDVPISVIEEYWEGHLATGSIGDWSNDMQPSMSYQEALRLANRDVEDLGADKIPVVRLEEPLNETSFVSEDDFYPTMNYQKSFEWGEFDHGVNSLVISITSVTIPIFVSAFRFLPGFSRWRSRLYAFLDQPLWGHRHRLPMRGNIGLMPTRGQSLFIAYILIVNVILMALPLRTLQPNSRMESVHMQQVQVVGDRAGVLAFCLYIALFLFSSRNNILLWITNWSHGTFLLLHRWVAYVCIFQTVMHSILMLYYYVRWNDHATESQLPYWYWGVIATLATCLMWPLSLLPVRQKMYQVFLSAHQILAALILIAGFLHIWYLFKWNWGYEIWIYAAGGLWFLDRLLRILRVAINGVRTAKITTVSENSDMIRIEIDDLAAEGHVYLYFPTLTWRFWESHPFSILSTYSGSAKWGSAGPGKQTMTRHALETEKRDTKELPETTQRAESPSSAEASAQCPPGEMIGPRATLLIRPQAGMTKALLARVREAGGDTSLPALIESSYYANPGTRELSHCTTLVAIAGGVGITAVLPLARAFGGLRSRIWWGVKHDDIIRSIKPELAQLSPSVGLETSVGTRLSVAEVLKDELLREDEKGNVGIVVCGPAAMADDARKIVGELASTGRAKRGVVFIDEAFSW